LSEAEAERALCEEFASGRGAGRDGTLEEVVDGLGLGAWDPLLLFFLGAGTGEDSEIEEGVAADASYSSATATVC